LHILPSVLCISDVVEQCSASVQCCGRYFTAASGTWC